MKVRFIGEETSTTRLAGLHLGDVVEVVEFVEVSLFPKEGDDRFYMCKHFVIHKSRFEVVE